MRRPEVSGLRPARFVCVWALREANMRARLSRTPRARHLWNGKENPKKLTQQRRYGGSDHAGAHNRDVIHLLSRRGRAERPMRALHGARGREHRGVCATIARTLSSSCVCESTGLDHGPTVLCEWSQS